MLVSPIITEPTLSTEAGETLTKAECLRVSTPCYCEENVYRILQLAATRGYSPQSLSAIFISNPERRIPIWMQRSGDERLDRLCVWDYHVVVAVNLHLQADAQIYDVDSTLNFPVSLGEYVRLALWHSPQACVAEHSGVEVIDMGHQFRCVSFDEMMTLFSSDRRHMMIPGSKTYFHPPPPYPCIAGKRTDNAHTLPLFLALNEPVVDDPFPVSHEEFSKVPGVLHTTASSLIGLT